METGRPPRLTRFSPLAALCVVLVVASAQVLSTWLLVDSEIAVGESVFAGMVATAVAITLGRFPI